MATELVTSIVTVDGIVQSGTAINIGTGLSVSGGALTATGGPPSGTAGGDLSGTYPNPTVAKINGVSLGSTTATAGNVLVGSGTTWVTKAVSGDASLASSGSLTVTGINGNPLGSTTPTAGNLLIGSGSTWVTQALSGDGTLSSGGALTLANSGVTASTYTNATVVVDAKGRITSASSGSVPTGANPTATIAGPAVNGSAATFMRSDASPALASIITQAETFQVSDSGTNTVTNSVNAEHSTSGTPTLGFGVAYRFLADSTTTAGRTQADITSTWTTATDASRKARLVVNAWDTAARECVRLEGTGTAAAIGFLGGNAVAQQTGDVGAALTAYNLVTSPSYAAASISGTISTGNLPAATNSTYGIVQPDDATLVITAGLLQVNGFNGFTWSNLHEWFANQTFANSSAGLAFAADIIVAGATYTFSGTHNVARCSDVDLSGGGVLTSTHAITVTDACTLTIDGPPAAPTGSVTITNFWSLNIISGGVRFSSTTGGAGQFIRQPTVGGAITTSVPTERNLLQNGSGRINQRGGSSSVGFTELYAFDRWRLCAQNNSVTWAQDTPTPAAGLPGSAMKWTKITSNGQMLVFQPLENKDTIPLQGQNVVVQAQLKCTGTNTVYYLGLLTWTGTADTLPANTVSSWGGSGVDPTFATGWALTNPSTNLTPSGTATISLNSLKCTVTSSYQQFAAVVQVPSNANNVAIVVWSDSMTTSDTMDMTALGLYLDNQLQSYQEPLYLTDLQECLYWFFSPSTTIALGRALNNTVLYAPFDFPRAMRVAPTNVTGTLAASTGSAGTVAQANVSTTSMNINNGSANWTTNALITATAFAMTADL